MAAPQLVLASASPRRSELLQQLGVRFICDPADIDETRSPAEAPRDYVQRMAREKADAVWQRQKFLKPVMLGLTKFSNMFKTVRITDNGTNRNRYDIDKFMARVISSRITNIGKIL